MSKQNLFKYLAAASGYTGLGLVLGYVLSDQAKNNPLWVGGILVLLGAILLGMAISAADNKKLLENGPDTDKERTQNTDSSSQQQ